MACSTGARTARRKKTLSGEPDFMLVVDKLFWALAVAKAAIRCDIQPAVVGTGPSGPLRLSRAA